MWRKKRNLKAAETDTVIQSRAPHLSLTPREYIPSASLSKLESDFTSRVQTFFRNTNIDEFNHSFMDGVISSTEQEALADLLRQRADHRGTIIDLIDKLWRGDRIKAEAKLEQTQSEIQECEDALRKLEEIYYRGTSMAENETLM